MYIGRTWLCFWRWISELWRPLYDQVLLKFFSQNCPYWVYRNSSIYSSGCPILPLVSEEVSTHLCSGKKSWLPKFTCLVSPCLGVGVLPCILTSLWILGQLLASPSGQLFPCLHRTVSPRLRTCELEAGSLLTCFILFWSLSVLRSLNHIPARNAWPPRLPVRLRILPSVQYYLF